MSDVRKKVSRFWLQDTTAFPDGAPQRDGFVSDAAFAHACAQYAAEWRETYHCAGCNVAGCPQCGAEPAPAHATSISHELPASGAALEGGHRARCSCGWWSDCHAQLSDTQRAVEAHLRRVNRKSFNELLARSSIGAAIADVKARGLDAHLVDLEKELHPYRRKPRLSAEDKAFMRGFGIALATIWRCHHDGQMVHHLVKANNFKLSSFRDVGLLDTDYDSIVHALEGRST